MIDNQVVLETETVENPVVASNKKRGRPRIAVRWPEENFTFESLTSVNVLSISSLRKKMRYELSVGGLLKVDTLKTAFGRPLNVYKKV